MIERLSTTMKAALLLAALVVGLTPRVLSQTQLVTKISAGSALPTNCLAGNVFIKTSATVGPYWCSTPGSPGTWSSFTSGAGTVTNTGTLTSGQIIKGNGGSDVTVGNLTGDVTTSGGMATTIAAGVVSLSKIANASASSKLLGSGASGSGSPYAEITLGTNLSMSGTTLNATGGGGGGITSYTSAYGSAPGSPNAGDLWFVTGSPFLARYSGSVWEYYLGGWGGMRAYPAAAQTWTNHLGSGTTTSTTNGTFSMVAGTGTNADNFQSYGHAVPTAPYTIDYCFSSLWIHSNYQMAGAYWRDSASGKFTWAGMQDGGVNDTMGFQVNQFTGNTYNATALNLRSEYGAGGAGVYCHRIADDNTNRSWAVSWDGGATYRTLYTTARTTWLTPDQVGFALNAYSSTAATQATVLSWREY